MAVSNQRNMVEKVLAGEIEPYFHIEPRLASNCLRVLVEFYSAGPDKPTGGVGLSPRERAVTDFLAKLSFNGGFERLREALAWSRKDMRELIADGAPAVEKCPAGANRELYLTVMRHIRLLTGAGDDLNT